MEPIIFDFGHALKVLKDGDYVRRRGWNGKGMFLFYVDEWGFIDDRLPEIELSPFIAMKTADGKIVPWLASQTDVLSEDWERV